MVRLLDATREGEGVQIFIGADNRAVRRCRLLDDRRALYATAASRWSARSA